MSQKFNALLQHHIQCGDILYQMPVKYVYGVALFYYSGESSYREITRRLKYDYDLPAGRFFTRILLRYLRQCQFFSDADYIVPVPLHRWRKWNRGYNQAAIIAQVLAEGLGLDMVENLLIRKRRTQTQTRLSVEEKMRNVENAFCMNSKYLSLLMDGRYHHVILVDDVFTTGATMLACYQAIMSEFYRRNLDFCNIRISLVTLGYVGN